MMSMKKQDLSIWKDLVSFCLPQCLQDRAYLWENFQENRFCSNVAKGEN